MIVEWPGHSSMPLITTIPRAGGASGEIKKRDFCFNPDKKFQEFVCNFFNGIDCD